MIIPAILAGIALALQIAVLTAILRARAEQWTGRKTTSRLMIMAIIATGVCLVWNSGSYVQQAAHVNLGLPSTLENKAQLWLKEHEKEKPDRKAVGRNIRIISDGLVFLKAYQDRLPADVKSQLEEYSNLPTRPDHVLNVSEEAQYHEAATGIITIIRRLASEQ